MSDIVKVNKIELASEIADWMLDEYHNEIGFPNGIFIETEDSTIYTEEAQEIFNKYYDKILTLIEEIMEYKESYLENGELKFKNVKQINQSELTSDCWLIQINGLSECDKCSVRNTDECGGGNTLKQLIKNKETLS